MANTNFIVHNGLTVGPISMSATTGDITGVGNLVLTGTANISTIQNGNSNVSVAANANVTISSTGVANIVTVTGTGANIAGYANISLGTITAAQSVLSKNVTWNNASVTFTALSTNITDTASAAGSLIADWKVGGVSQFTVSKAGALTITGNLSVPNLTATTNITTPLITTAATNTNLTITPNGTGVVKSSSSFLPTSNATLNLGASGAYWATVYGQATTALYADLAENYLADKIYEPGTVVSFGGKREIMMSDVDMDVRVAGVVSTNPAHLMNGGLEGDFVTPLALTGRVPTKVWGPVKKGDLMVSAGDGRARSEVEPAIGSVIGKALEHFDGDDGVIEVVVGRI